MAQQGQQKPKQGQPAPPGKPHPVLKVRAVGGRIEAAVWANEIEKNGERVTRHSVTLRKSFKRDEKAPWEEQSINLFMDEIHDVVLVLTNVEQQFRLTYPAVT